MGESVRDQVIRTLDRAGAFCGQCGREPGSPLSDCPDCERVLGGYADAIAADGLLRDDEPASCGRGPCAAEAGHEGTCAEASGWADDGE